MMEFRGEGMLSKGLVTSEICEYTLFPLQMERGIRPEVHWLRGITAYIL